MVGVEFEVCGVFMHRVAGEMQVGAVWILPAVTYIPQLQVHTRQKAAIQRADTCARAKVSV